MIQIGGACKRDGGAGVDTWVSSIKVSLLLDTDGDGQADEVLATAGYTVNPTERRHHC
ncbi:MAG: hypothetical protein IPL62_18000 [Caulobacteraceae bacterium]|nr:hypothetical protein [Caulobacteraceae bacterium]